MTDPESTARGNRLRERIRDWNRPIDAADTDIEREIAETGRITYRCVDADDGSGDHRSTDVPRPAVSDEELDAWRSGTTGLSPEDADRLWQWYNDVYETALVNGNRTRGVRAFFERSALFPWRTATCGRHRYDSARSTLPSEWAEWVIDVTVTHADVNRDDLLVERQGPADVPRPTIR